VLLGLGAEVQLVDVVDDLAQVVAALNLVLDLAEYLSDFVFDGVGAAGLLLEAVQVGKELLVHEVAEVVAGQGTVVVEIAVLVLGRGPAFPAIRLIEDVSVFLAVERGLGALVLLKIVEVFQEQQPGGLLGVVELGGAARFFPEDVIDVFEGLFEHGDRFVGTVLYTTSGSGVAENPAFPKARGCGRIAAEPVEPQERTSQKGTGRGVGDLSQTL